MAMSWIKHSIPRKGRYSPPTTAVSKPALAPQPGHPVGTWTPSPGAKRPEHEADHSPPSSAEVKNAWSYTTTLPCVSRGATLSLPLPFTVPSSTEEQAMKGHRWRGGKTPCILVLGTKWRWPVGFMFQPLYTLSLLGWFVMLFIDAVSTS